MLSNVLCILLLVGVFSNTIVAGAEPAAQCAAAGVRAPDDPNSNGFSPVLPFLDVPKQSP